jgi:hypothetical protein
MPIVQNTEEWGMKKITILLVIFFMSLSVWFPGAQQTVLAAEKAVQMTVPECNA